MTDFDMTARRLDNGEPAAVTGGMAPNVDRLNFD